MLEHLTSLELRAACEKCPQESLDLKKVFQVCDWSKHLNNTHFDWFVKNKLRIWIGKIQFHFMEKGWNERFNLFQTLSYNVFNILWLPERLFFQVAFFIQLSKVLNLK